VKQERGSSADGVIADLTLPLIVGVRSINTQTYCSL